MKKGQGLGKKRINNRVTMGTPSDTEGSKVIFVSCQGTYVIFLIQHAGFHDN